MPVPNRKGARIREVRACGREGLPHSPVLWLLGRLFISFLIWGSVSVEVPQKLLLLSQDDIPALACAYDLRDGHSKAGPPPLQHRPEFRKLRASLYGNEEGHGPGLLYKKSTECLCFARGIRGPVWPVARIVDRTLPSACMSVTFLNDLPDINISNM